MSTGISPSATTDERYNVVKQLEFYFSDSNILSDKFLRELAEKDDGFVELDIISKFKRMAPYADKKDLVVDALKLSTRLKISDDNTKVARINPMPSRDSVLDRTIYVKNLDKMANVPMPEQQCKYEEFFTTFGQCLSVRLVRANKTFIGKAFVEYSSAAEVEKVLSTAQRQNNSVIPMETAKHYAGRKADQWGVPSEMVLERIIERKYHKPRNVDQVIIPKTCSEELYGEIGGKRFLFNSIVRYTNGPEGLNSQMLKPLLATAPTLVRFIDTTDNGKSGVLQLDDPRADEFIGQMDNEIKFGDNALSLSRIEAIYDTR
ncbi:hypothetical protein BDF19DRAFT_228796 [Syncephalis fuscata]|nr:hypothetical protein BDF19DRAFT_228796 [Syncephalis fuscata]